MYVLDNNKQEREKILDVTLIDVVEINESVRLQTNARGVSRKKSRKSLHKV